ncbi:hypothetical protein ES703_87796 [subsurface metagenome]
MPERGFDTGFWTEDFVLGLPYPAKHLFHYLGSNDHCNQAGAYHIVPKTISFESGIPESELPALLKMLEPAVKWLPEENLIWVKDFLYHQAKSPKFLVAAAKCLKKIRNTGLVVEVVEYNLTHYTISIPYGYPIDMVSILPVSDSVSDSVSRSDSVSGSEKGDEVVKGKGEPQTTLDEEKVELLRLTRGLKHWRTTPDDEEWLSRFLQEFPEFDKGCLTACADYHSGRSEAKHKGEWKNRLRNWMLKQRQFAQERRQHGQTKGERVKAHPREAYRGKW